jgi:hypothetical protein
MTNEELEHIKQCVAWADQCRCDIDNGDRIWDEAFDKNAPIEKLPPSILIGAGITAARDLIKEVERLREIEKSYDFPDFISEVET